MKCFTAPITVYGEGTYAISDVKEIKVTDEYLGLDENIRKCQNTEAFEDCTTRNHIETVRETCNCVPYSLKGFLTNMVWYVSLFLRNNGLIYLYFRQHVHCKTRVLRMSRLTLISAWFHVRESLLM